MGAPSLDSRNFFPAARVEGALKMEMVMKLAALLLACLAANSPRTQLTYAAVRGSEARTHRIAFEGSNPGPDYRLAFDGIPHPLRNLPLWLPDDLRKPGTVIYDDGEGFKHDQGKETYILSSTSKWKKFTAVGLYYAYQGIQESDNWTLEAQYDKASGYLLSATVRTRIGRSTGATYDLSLTSK
jgi:hypothetical protein